TFRALTEGVYSRPGEAILLMLWLGEGPEHVGGDQAGPPAGDRIPPVMTNLFRVCKKCGAKISSDPTQGVCPACLLERGLGLFEEESVSEVGSFAEAAEKPGSAKADGVGPGDNFRPAARKKTTRLARSIGDFGDYELLEEI